tara:strand:+ start:348 stop:779 length:432 start_codon:yes stop_codon:yes gene_type:complete
MKLIAVLLLIGATTAPVFAGGPATGYRSRGGYAKQEKCFKREYREKYIPGTMNNPGYVKRYNKKVQVPCEKEYVPQTLPHHYYEEPYPNVGNVDNNSCAEGTVAGGLLGGALGGVLSTKDNWIWAIPSGIVGGAMLGCQMDGG